MTENLSESVTVTDAQVDDFFNNDGNFSEPEVVKAPEKTEEPKKEPDVDKDEPKEEKKVNLGALHEERTRRKAESERAKKAEERAAELERQLQQYSQPRQENDDDPIETMKQRQERVERFLAAQANQAIQQTENQKYWAKVKDSELAYKQEHPDFDDAIKFLGESRKDELKDLGFSDVEASKVLADEIKWIADKAYADEVNPAERFHKLALKRGYAAKKEEPKDTSADDKLESIKRGMETNRQLPPASKSVRQDLTAEALGDMPIDALSNLHGPTDFDKAWAKLFGAN